MDNRGYMFERMNIDTLSERLKLAMEEGGFTQASLAEAAGIAQPSVWKIATGKTKTSSRVVELATALGVRPEWLANGIGPMREGKSSTSDGQDIDPTTKLPGVFVVPFFDGDRKTSNVAVVPDSIKSKNCRAYRLSHDTGFPEMPKSSVIVIDTDEKPGNNDFVYATTGNSQAVYRYMLGDNDGYLVPSNDRLPVIPIGDKAKIIGVVVYISRTIKR